MTSSAAIEKQYKIKSTLGEGAFGTVCLAVRNRDQKEFAIKKTKEPVKDWRLEREVMATRQIGVHPNIVKALEVHYDTKLQSVNIVFEYMNAGCLHQLIESHLVKKQFVEEHFIQSIMYQMLEGIEHCHRSGWMHRDLKPENILLHTKCNSDGTMGTICKIADFSLARRVPSGRLSQDNQLMSPVTSYVSTRWYRAPEMLLNDKNISYPVDIFALGCIMAELFELTALFPGKSEVDQLHKVLHFLGAPTASHWPEGFRLAQKISVELSGLSPSKGTLHELIIAQTRAGMYTPPVLLEQQRHTTVIRTKPVAAPITPPNNGGHTGAPIIPRLSGQMEKNRPVSPWAFDLFRNLIELDPGQRLSATQALEHEYFRGGILVVDGPTKSNNAKIDHGMDSLTLCELQSLPQPCQVGTLQPSQQLLVSAPRDRDVIFDLGAAKRRRLIALGR